MSLEKLLSKAKNIRQLPQYDFREYIVDGNWDRDDVLLLFEDDVVVAIADKQKAKNLAKELRVYTTTLFYKGFYYLALRKKDLRNSVYMYK